MKNFEGLDLHPTLNKSLQKMGYDTPTPIQAKAIPFALDGRDIMGSAQTGTGKTAAFAIPLIQHLLNSENSCALVLTPTRELGKQIMEIMHQLIGPASEINTAFLIGGDSMQKQNNQLKKRPRLIVGTPGRINDHLERGSLYLKNTDFLVLDETDRMLDMGFSVQLDRIFKYLPQDRQTLMFSATLPKDIVRMSESYLTNPERIAVGSTINPAENIKQEVIHLSEAEKFDEFTRQLDERSGTIVVFVKTKFATERMAKRLKAQGMEADAIHGDLKQSRRSRVIQSFRDLKFRILVATDVVARGLDIPHIEHVINYDLPQVPEDYIHRIGRTARAGAKGSSLCLVTPQDARKWNDIEMLMNPEMKSKYAPERKGKGSRGGKAHFKDGPRKSKGGKSFGKPSDPRANRNVNDNRGGKRDDFYGDKPKFDNARTDRPRSEKPSYDKPRSEKTWGDKPRSDKPYGDKPRSEKSFDKPKFDKPKSFRKSENGEKSNYRGDKKTFGDKPKFDNARADRPRSEKPSYDKPRSEKTWGDKPRADKPKFDKPRGEKSFDKPFKKKFTENRNSSTEGEQPRGRGKPFGDRPTGKPVSKSGAKPFGKPEFGKSTSKPSGKPAGKKPFGKSFGKPGAKSGVSKPYSPTRGTAKGAPQKGKKVFQGKKSKQAER